jgi:hypothetical protein
VLKLLLYKRITYISIIICSITLPISYYFNYINESFWSNTITGIFASGVLTLVGSIIGYFTLKIRILNEVYISYHLMMKKINIYFNSNNPEITTYEYVRQILSEGEKCVNYLRDFSLLIKKSRLNKNLYIFSQSVKSFFFELKINPNHKTSKLNFTDNIEIEVSSYKDFEELYLNFIKSAFGKQKYYEETNNLYFNDYIDLKN